MAPGLCCSRSSGCLPSAAAQCRWVGTRLQVRGSVHEHWCDLELHIDADRPAEEVEVAAEDGSRVRGLRWRLKPLQLNASRALAADGKLVVRHGSRCAEALLQLPTVPVRSANQGPTGLWLTAGLLAADGLALQLRLKKADMVSGDTAPWRGREGFVVGVEEEHAEPRGDRTLPRAR